MNIENFDRPEFLKQLDQSEVEVTDWEAGFIESNLDRREFTEKQQAIIDRLYKKYGDQLTA